MTSMNVSLSARNIVKRFGGVIALSDGNLEVRSGSVVALLGANGSGKSTLAKIITGVLEADDGVVELDGGPVSFSSPQVAMQQGIAAVYQELSLIPDMTVAENIWLGHAPLRWGLRVDKRETHRRTADLLSIFAGTYQSTLEPDAPVSSLPPDEKQIVEILKALSRKPRLMILDEATASLDSRQVQRLFELMGTWKEEGMALVFVSHRMDEIFRVADQALVLRNGKTVGNLPMSETSERDLVSLMVGAEAVAPEITASEEGAAQATPAGGHRRLEVRELVNDRLHEVSLTLHDGELLGLGGLRGQGQEALLLAIFGATPFHGEMALDGEAVHFKHPRAAMKQNVAYVPGERGSQGLLLIRSILENLQLPSWARYGTPLRMADARADAARAAAELNMVMASLDAPVESLSGGNAQKVVLGKWLLREPKLLLLNDPTKGVDVGAKAEFYKLLTDLRNAGAAILFYSSDDDELLGLCDRVLVMHDGHIRAELTDDELTRANLVAASMGAPQNMDNHADVREAT